jgi:hypothetical protein
MELSGEVHATGRLTPGEVRGLVGPMWAIWSRKENPLAPAGNEMNRISIPQTSSPYPILCIDPEILVPYPRIITNIGNIFSLR